MAFGQRSIVSFSLLLLATSSGLASEPTPAALDFFEKKIRPLLVENCYNCHSANTNSKGGLRVDDRNGLLTGGGKGPAVVPGQPEKSLLISKINHTDAKVRMPLGKELTREQNADMTKWIQDGAAWPKVALPAAISKHNPNYDKLRKEHWAWQPLAVLKAPPVADAAWARDDIDRFVLAKLEENRLKPVGDADRAALIRRLTFDLIGLPPTLDEIDAFVEESGAKPQAALEKLVDRLLASPAFGERWGRHWLDVARYGESTGSARNLPYPHAWRYRDYVIDSFNSDKPYDQFIREQIAGDLLPAQSPKERDEHLVATGFLALGVKDVNQRFKVRFTMDNIDEQIDTVSRGVLALTASCARCHDHKFDPISTKEYYALAGIFHSSDNCSGLRNKMGGGGLDYFDPSMFLRLASSKPTAPAATEQVAQLKKEFEQAKAEWDAIRGTPKGLAKAADGMPVQRPYRLKFEKLQAEVQALADPTALSEIAMGVREGKTIGDTEIRIRGEAEQHGPVVPRGFLSLVDVPNAPKINVKQSGRLELAQWLTSDKNPLAQRVIVNRIWQHLFGQGLVKSVDNFGVTGEAPSHPELLDHLADRFVRDGWSIKKMVKALVLTRAYQLSSQTNPQSAIHNPQSEDPDNRLVWRHSPRRLDAEEIRDAMLVVAGKLNPARPQGSAAKDLKVIEMRNNGPEAKQIIDQANASQERSVYLPLVRTLVPTCLEVFDFAEQGMVTGSRDATTVAPQALYLLNDPFVIKQSLNLAERIHQKSDLDDSQRIHLAYRLTLARKATASEIERAKIYLTEYEADVRKEEKKSAVSARTAAWASYCQALLASAEFRFVR